MLEILMDFYEEIESQVIEAKTMEDSAEALSELLRGDFSVWTDGRLYSIRQLVDRVKGLKIYVYSDEHAPPHFHIKSPDVDASFTISDCEYLKGNIDSREQNLVKWWWERSKPLLIKTWNETRPTDCQVGPVNEKT